jgi:hypothetical protein
MLAARYRAAELSRRTYRRCACVREPGEAVRHQDPHHVAYAGSPARISGAAQALSAHAGAPARSRTAPSSCGSTHPGTTPAPAVWAPPLQAPRLLRTRHGRAPRRAKVPNLAAMAPDPAT